MTSTYTRRSILSAAAAAAAAATGAALTSCGGPSTTADPSGPSSTGSSPSRSARPVELPAYQPYTGAKPDKPGTDDGVVDPLFSAYPSPAPSVFGDAKPAASESISAMVRLDAAMPPPPLAKNGFWQALNKRLGTELDVRLTPNVDYASKLATTIAANDLPDLVQIPVPPAPARLPGLLADKFADLTDHLSGSAIADYPGLANFPTSWWRGAVYNNAIYGIPRGVSVALTALYQRADLLRAAGIDPDFSDGKEFLEACRALTDVKKNRWATANPLGTLSMLAQMHGGPNGWRAHDGEFTSAYEDPSAQEALEVARKMWSEGLFEPDSFLPSSNPRTWFGGGRIALWYPGADPVLMEQQFSTETPGYELRLLAPPKWDGGGLAPYFLGNPTRGVTAVRKAAKERIQEILRVMDFLAAPFGTQEYEFLTFGVKGRDHTMDGTNPVLTDTGQAEVNPMQLRNLVAAPYALYSVDYSDAYVKRWTLQRQVRSVAVSDPSFGLFSATSIDKGGQLTKAVTQAQGDIIQGRKSVESWTDVVKRWRSDGGDRIRRELEAAYADSQ